MRLFFLLLPILSATFPTDSLLFELFSENRKSDREQAAEYAARFVEAADSSLADPRTAETCAYLAAYEKDRFKFSAAIEWFERALRQYEMLQDLQGTADAEYELGRLQYRKGRYDLALARLNRSLDLYRTLKDEKGYAESCNGLAGVYFSCRNYEQTERYTRLFLESARKMNDTALIVTGLNNCAAYANHRGDSLNARTLINESIRLCQAGRDSALLCRMYLNITASYLNTGNLDEVDRYLHLAAPLLHDISLFGQYHYMYGIKELMQNRDDSAAYHLNRAVSYYRQGEFDANLQTCHALLETICSKKKDTAAAYRHLKEYYEINRRLGRENVFVELFNYQNDIIEQKEQEKIQSRRNAILWYLTLSVFTLVTVILLTLILLRTKARNQAEMKAQKMMLEMKRMQEFRTSKLTQNAIDRLSTMERDTAAHEMRMQVRQIADELRLSQDAGQLEEISQYIPDFDSGFYRRLVKEHPELSTNERRLCALLNLNLSTKDISEITRQSPHSIKIARYRLRNKLGLTGTKTTLQEYLTRFNS